MSNPYQDKFDFSGTYWHRKSHPDQQLADHEAMRFWRQMHRFLLKSRKDAAFFVLFR